MSEVVKSTVLYDREQDGVHVQSRQEVVQVPVEGKEGQYTEEKRYVVEAHFNGELVKSQAGEGYRQTIFDGRTMFKEVYHEKVGQFAEAKAAEEKAAKEAEKAKKQQEREEKAQAKAAEAARKAQERAEKAAAKAAAAQKATTEESTDADEASPSEDSEEE